jgi:uncharacterized spore protein YtfJ
LAKQARDRDFLRLRRVIAALGGARLCFGKPVKAGERVVIPVARVRSAGGFGFGQGEVGDGGGGGGGAIDAAPIGFIEITPEQTRFESIPDPAGTALAVRNVAAAAGVLAAAFGAFRQQRRGKLPSHRRLLPR